MGDPVDPVPRYAVGDYVWTYLSVAPIAKILIEPYERGGRNLVWYQVLNENGDVAAARYEEGVLAREIPPGIRTQEEAVVIATAVCDLVRVEHEKQETEKQERWATHGRPVLTTTCSVCKRSVQHLEGEVPPTLPKLKPGPSRLFDDSWSHTISMDGTPVEHFCSSRCSRAWRLRQIPLWKRVAIAPIWFVVSIPSRLGASYCPCCQPGLRGFFSSIFHHIFPPRCTEPECLLVAATRCSECRAKVCMSHAFSGWHTHRVHDGPKPKIETLLAMGLDVLGRSEVQSK